MKNQPPIYSTQFVRRLIPFLVFCLAIGVSFAMHFLPGIHAAKTFHEFILEMVAFLPLMFILIGLFDIWFPRNIVERHIGKDSGVKGALWVIFLATIQAGPLYSSFPVAYMLWKKGCNPFNIFVYLGAFSVMKIPMLTFEVGFLGQKQKCLHRLGDGLVEGWRAENIAVKTFYVSRFLDVGNLLDSSLVACETYAFGDEFRHLLSVARAAVISDKHLLHNSVSFRIVVISGWH